MTPPYVYVSTCVVRSPGSGLRSFDRRDPFGATVGLQSIFVLIDSLRPLTRSDLDSVVPSRGDDAVTVGLSLYESTTTGDHRRSRDVESGALKTLFREGPPLDFESHP